MNSAKTMVNVSPKMSNRDAIERELEKFVKMFSTKAVQAIVQSRLGDKMQTFSNPRSLSNDWVSEPFNNKKTHLCITLLSFRGKKRRNKNKNHRIIVANDGK